MSGLTIPTDSVLRRHFDQYAASRGFPPLPEDSVLRRHYLQALEADLSGVMPGARAQAAPPPPSPEPPAAEPAAPAEAPAAASAEAPSAEPASSGSDSGQQPQGWFSRLMSKLFG